MKIKRLIFNSALVIIILTILQTPALAKDEIPRKVLSSKLQPVTSYNLNKNNYSTWADTVTSHLYLNDKNITRVEYISNYNPDEKYVLIEDYDKKFNLKSQKKIKPDLPSWGGFFAGESYNFLVFGQSNPKEDDNCEVIRLVKYSKEWEKLGHVSLRGANTTIPFRAGSLRFDEYKDMLYIRTAHQMYKSKNDGLNHQANLTFSVNTDDMNITDSFYDVMNIGYGYASHSFNQFIKIDSEGNIVSVDHGDAYPRSIVMLKYGTKAGIDKFIKGSYDKQNTWVDILRFSGVIGDNYTGASVGGLQETSTGYLVTYNKAIDRESSEREIFLSYIPKGDLDEEKVKTKKVSKVGSTPHLIARGLDHGYLLWNELTPNPNPEYWHPKGPRKLTYVKYDQLANVSTKQSIKDAPLSDCQPIPYEDGILWYTTEDSEPVFYHLGPDGLIEFVSRISGSNRYETAIEASEKTYPDGAENVILAGKLGEVDALTATLLSEVKEAPLLLVDEYKDVEKQIKKLGAKKLYILGGESVVSKDVFNKLQTDGYKLQRVAGKNRYATAVEVAKEALGKTDHVLLANSGRSGSLVDALASGPLSGRDKAPILLTEKDRMPEITLEAMLDLGVKNVTLIGGSSVISDKVVEELKANDINVEYRAGGKNRYDTAKKIAEKYFEKSTKAILVNDGKINNSYADAVVGGYMGVKNDAPILLTSTDELNAYTQSYLKNKIDKVYVLR